MTEPNHQFLFRFRYHILGQLEVRRFGQVVEVGGDKAKRLLATLLLQPRHTVSTDVLVDVLWPAAPPRSAVANLRTYVSSLRARLGVSGDGPLQTRPSGYRIDLDDDASDLIRFEQLVGEARRQHGSGDTVRASALLDEANRLWRGDPLADLSPAPEWEITISRLKALRLEAEELRLGTLISLGRPTQAIPDLRALVSEHPLREQLWFELVRALHGAGRRAEALQAYVDARTVLVDELGIDPGPALRGLQRTVLADADLDSEPRGEAYVPPPRVFQTPADTADFVGRKAETAEIATALEIATGPTFVLLTGPAGVGKSALAVHAAHRFRGRFPDGQIYVDCRGTDERGATDLLAEALGALGVPAGALAPGLAGRAAQFRSLLADRAVLVIVDNAATADQIAAFLPATTGSAALVSSRHHHPPLCRAFGASRCPLSKIPTPTSCSRNCLASTASTPNRPPRKPS
ncbi:AfsR/SARP family transcriptional regulator [Fodinicola feengrottensis]|uniref:AfsR/SARP family transcriptional regulator n=1 Tax=Fodinicola feengrottensis TaxID=435914 RepID=UPI0013D30162|nr:transcriptional regulator [Fodinicola feengrottensis]